VGDETGHIVGYGTDDCTVIPWLGALSQLGLMEHFGPFLSSRRVLVQ
jgi:hypothetical protein